jgi:hypothetical protein
LKIEKSERDSRETGWSTGRIDPQRERLQRLLELEFFLTELSEFYSPGEAKLWLFSPHKLLGGETAAARAARRRTCSRCSINCDRVRTFSE